MSKKIKFSKEEINDIKNIYLNGESCQNISKMYGVSKSPINKILKECGILRNGNSNGKKILLTQEEENKIKDLYINHYKNNKEISKIMNLTISFVNKYLQNSGYRRNKSEGTSIGMVKRFTNIPYNNFLSNLSEFKKYKRKVISITKKQPIHLLENYENRGIAGKKDSFHLDHKFSIVEGFKQKISPVLIGDIKNLEFIPWKLNLEKRTNCSITTEELFKN